ncbi:MAG: hypothetical protein MJY56_05640 [Bacteroidales bacterium]|nr:hypothetical protein [Bacteroidales bacterium]
MKKLSLAVLAALLFLLSSCLNNAETKYHILTVDPEFLYLKVGETQDFSIQYNYYDSNDPEHTVSIEDFHFSFDPEGIASVEIIEEETEFGGQTFKAYVPRLTALAEGSTAMLVTVDESKAYAIITVLPAGEEETEGDNTEE